jgi:serine/threonine-protein kinase
VEAEKAGHRLAQVLYALRRELGDDVLHGTTSEPRLDSKVLASDVAEFTESLERGDLERAVGLYTGPFLDCFHLGDAAGFERWVDGERERFAREYLGALGALASAADRRGDHLAAVEWWRRLATEDRLSSRAATGYMEALSRVGERTAALQYARVYEALLRDELDAPADPAVATVVNRLKIEADEEAASIIRAPPELGQPAPQRIGGRYLAERQLGEGEVGTVYAARDLKHGRRVALKLFLTSVDPDLPRRLAVSASLHHPHILPLYDAGVADGRAYAVMPEIQAGSLRARFDREGPLQVYDAVRIVKQAAEALDYAHRRGVVHGHVTADNILLEEGHTLLTDFAGRSGPESHPRDDIHALAWVMYEVLAGEPPTSSEAGGQSIRTIRRAVPREIDAALERALAPNPADRFASAADFAAALSPQGHDGFRPALPATQERSIAVLPFLDIGGMEDDQYFSHGMTEELINALVKVPGLRVASRTSSFAVTGKGLDVRAIGERLGVQVLAEGSVRRMGDRLRVTAQLVATADGYHLWSETYDRTMSDLFAIQEEIAGTIASTLKLKLSQAGELVRPGTRDLDVYNIYLKGRYFWNQRTPQGLQQSVKYFQQAIEADPNFALPYTGIADAYHVLSVYGVLRPLEYYPKARAAASRALELDPSLAEAHASLAHVAFVYDLDHAGAEREYLKALEINPRHAPAHHWYGWLLTVLGRREEAVSHARRAVELEPLSTIILTRAGDILSYADHFDEAAELCQRALELNPNFYGALEVIALNESRRGDPDRAMAAIECLRAAPGNQLSTTIPWLLAKAGRRKEALDMLSDLNLDPDAETVPTGYMAAWLAGAYAALGDIDLGYRWADRLIEERTFGVQFWKVDRGYDPLRGDPRFDVISRRLGLE